MSVQKLLWVLISLSNDDFVYKDDMREAGLPAVMAALFSVYQANQGAAELRPIAAQILRWVPKGGRGGDQMDAGHLTGAVQQHYGVEHTAKPARRFPGFGRSAVFTL